MLAIEEHWRLWVWALYNLWSCIQDSKSLFMGLSACTGSLETFQTSTCRVWGLFGGHLWAAQRDVAWSYEDTLIASHSALWTTVWQCLTFHGCCGHKDCQSWEMISRVTARCGQVIELQVTVIADLGLIWHCKPRHWLFLDPAIWAITYRLRCTMSLS